MLCSRNGETCSTCGHTAAQTNSHLSSNHQLLVLSREAVQWENGETCSTCGHTNAQTNSQPAKEALLSCSMLCSNDIRRRAANGPHLSGPLIQHVLLQSAQPKLMCAVQWENGETCSTCGHTTAQTHSQLAKEGALPSEIIPGQLYLGSHDHASRNSLLKALGITHMLNVRPGTLNYSILISIVQLAFGCLE